MALLQMNYDSHALGKMATANLIVPQGVPGPYAVMFLLHGLSDDHSAWCRRTSIERYVEGLPLIVVMPDGGEGSMPMRSRATRSAPHSESSFRL